MSNPLVELVRALETVEHVKLPGMGFSRCPSCLSPRDLSEPHEQTCRLEAALAAFKRWRPWEDAEAVRESSRAIHLEEWCRPDRETCGGTSATSDAHARSALKALWQHLGLYSEET